MSNQQPYGQQDDGQYDGQYGDSYQNQSQNQDQGYDPYQQQQQQPQAQAWPGQQQAYDDAQAQQYTQQWQGQTWETQMQAPVTTPPAAPAAPAAVAEAPGTPYLPSQGHEAGAADAGYGPATVAGNARITDAQRARLEGRSPIIEPGLQPAALTAVLGLLMSGTAAIGSYALVVPLVILQAVTAAGWFRLNGMWPARQGIALAFAGALTADVALLAAGRENAPAAILGTLGVWVLLTLVLQLRSHADPDTRMYGLMATIASAALAIIAAGHLAADPDAVTVGAAAVAVAVLARALPLPTAASVGLPCWRLRGPGSRSGG